MKEDIDKIMASQRNVLTGSTLARRLPSPRQEVDSRFAPDGCGENTHRVEPRKTTTDVGSCRDLYGAVFFIHIYYIYIFPVHI